MINLYPYFYHDKPVSMFYHGKPVSMFYHDIPVSIFLSKQKNEWGSKRINLAVFHFLEMKIYSIYVYIYIYVKDISSNYYHTVKVWAIQGGLELIIWETLFVYIIH